MNDVIGAHHQFHDKEFVMDWAERFVPTPERMELFNVILLHLKSAVPANGSIIELGIGPGYLANHLLNAMPKIHYYGVDFSNPMLEIAQQRLKLHSDRISFVKADLVKDNWQKDIPPPVNAVVSTWSLHDLGNQKNVEIVYQRCAQALQDSGILLNGDFIKPDKAKYEYEKGRFEIANHIEILRRVGFKHAECLVVLEEEIESPTAAQNYACFKAMI